jgi:surface protein
MSRVFNFNNQFNGNISEWNVSNVEDMYSMFENSAFNGDISQWNVSKVTNMNYMFHKSKFTGDISNWMPYSLKSTSDIFDKSHINKPFWSEIEGNERIEHTININHLRNLIKQEIVKKGKECDLNHIDVSSFTNLSGLFKDIEFNGDISKWDVSNVEYMSSMFSGSGFKGDLSNWKPYKLRKVDNVFLDCPINPPYWTNYSNKKLRNKAINIYVFNNELKNELSVNENNTKILKI